VPKKPDTIRLGGFRARPFRPPTARDSRWYWLIESGKNSQHGRGRMTVQEATEALAQLVANGHTPASHAAARECRTLYQLMGFWLGAKLQELTNANSQRNARLSKRRLVGQKGAVTELGRTPLERVSERLVEAWYHGRVSDGRSPLTAYNDVRRVPEAWKWGRRHRLHTFPDLDVRIRRPRHGIRPKETVAREDIPRILAAVGPEWARLALLAYAMTGARLGEVAEIRRCDVDLRGCRLRVGTGRSSKTGERWIHVPVALLDALRPLVESVSPRDRIWPVTYATMLSGVNEHLHRACERANIEHRLTTHSFRRMVVDTYASRVGDPATAAEQLGHSPQTMLAAYRRVSDADRREAVQQAGLEDGLTQ
jgi:integrase